MVVGSFTVKKRDGLARVGVLETAHGAIDTPAFMSVGTMGAVKGVLFDQIKELGAQIVLMNAFHLAWRPGEDLVAELGGLRRFCGWNGPILTDSGGFQIFSLPGLRKVTDEGAAFAGPYDGRQRMFTPENVVELQWTLGADILMPLDECPPHPCSPAVLASAVTRSLLWAKRSRRRHAAVSAAGGEAYSRERFSRLHFGIVQGGIDERERARSLAETAALEFDGYALGGVCVGEQAEESHRIVAFTAPRLPDDKPRYLMGVGKPLDILHAIGGGVDMFDCTIPTRNGRNGTIYTAEGLLRIRNARYARDPQPLDERCVCPTCRTFSRAALRHFLLSKEINAAMLLSIHNLAFYLKLMKDAREAIAAGAFQAYFRAQESIWRANESADDESEKSDGPDD
jgi:queuine tRNA-ribosyltransferase